MILKTYFDFNGNFEVKYKANDTIETKTIEAISFKNFMDIAKSKKSPKNQVVDESADYILTVKPEIKTAIIDFKYFNDEEKFDLFLKKSFDSINKLGIKNLIIDIRANGGGNSALGDQLTSANRRLARLRIL
jgi:C-terminal processing protease CtpA/Prc